MQVPPDLAEPTHEGIQVTKGKAVCAPNMTLNRRQEAHMVSLVHSGEYSTAEVAELFAIGRSTVYRAIEQPRVEARAGFAEATSKRCPTALGFGSPASNTRVLPWRAPGSEMKAQLPRRATSRPAAEFSSWDRATPTASYRLVRTLGRVRGFGCKGGWHSRG
jgi:transposase-like protein